jgi:hypothetical protein
MWSYWLAIATYIVLNVLQADMQDRARAKGLHAATLFMVASAVLCFGAITARMSAGKCAELHVASSSMWRWFSGGLPLLLVAAIVLFDGVADGLFVVAQLRLHIAKHVVANHMSVVFGLVTMKAVGELVTWQMAAAACIIVGGVTMAFVPAMQDVVTMNGLVVALVSRLVLEGAVVAERRAMNHETAHQLPNGEIITVKTASSSVINVQNTALAPVMVALLCISDDIRAAIATDLRAIGVPFAVFGAVTAAVIALTSFLDDNNSMRRACLVAMTVIGAAYVTDEFDGNPKLAWAAAYAAISAAIMTLKMHCHTLDCTNATYGACKAVTMIVTVLRRDCSVESLRAMAVLGIGSAALLVSSVRAAKQQKQHAQDTHEHED